MGREPMGDDWFGLTPPRSPCRKRGPRSGVSPDRAAHGNKTGNIMNTYKFRNSQGCILDTIAAKSSRSAWAKFRKTWSVASGDKVTCEDHGPAEA